MRGFKSFASATTLDFLPGVSAVVGPNGSGKSNVVDALSWVMGEQGAKSLRGASMDDVIFAGTSSRPALGRAQVTLTIDNSDGLLPIEYTEVTISRTLFRSGGSEYAINGQTCRLLDIQELLSDTGVGRQMHVIVGQGQLDQVLHASAQERRGFIEEAAGVLKHRRRKERALRKLDAMGANLARLTDLTAEVRRQLTPLGKQAQVARRAQRIQYEVRDAGARLLADEVVRATAAWEQGQEKEREHRACQEKLAAQLEQLRARAESVEGECDRLGAQWRHWREVGEHLRTHQERLGALVTLAGQRRELLNTVEPVNAGPDSEQLERQAADAQQECDVLAAQVREQQEAVVAATAVREGAEEAERVEEARLARMWRAAADRREAVARLHASVAGAQAAIERLSQESERLAQECSSLSGSARQAQDEYVSLEAQLVSVEAQEQALDAGLEGAQGRLEQVQRRRGEGTECLRGLEAQRQSLAARLEGLRTALAHRESGVEFEGCDIPGVDAPLTHTLAVQGGWERAIIAALGPLAEARTVADLGQACEVMAWARQREVGRVSIVTRSGILPPPFVRPGVGELKAVVPAAVPALDVVTGGAPLPPAVETVLRMVLLVSTVDEARRVVEVDARVTAVTAAGEVVGPGYACGGSAVAPSPLELLAEITDIQKQLERVEAAIARVQAEDARLAEQLTRAQSEVNAAFEALNESDARVSSVTEALSQWGARVREGAARQQQLEQKQALVQEQLRDQRAEAARLQCQAQEAEAAPEDEVNTEERERRAQAATQARQDEVKAQLALRSSQEQLVAAQSRARSAEAAAQEGRRAQAQAQRRLLERQRQTAKAEAVAQAAAWVLEQLHGGVRAARVRQEQVGRQREQASGERTGLRQQLEQLGKELTELTEAAHRVEVAHAHQQVAVEQARKRCVDEFSIPPDELVEQYGPHVPVPTGEDSSEQVPFDRGEQRERLKRARAELAALGAVNPLALEEFAALEQRHTFLSNQLEDLRKSRQDLMNIVADIDAHVEKVFSQAFQDTAAQFERIFSRLFPGGEGQLVLTEPGDMLASGVEVKARPAGKKISRLSLLSGGERSLTAVALLVAIFKARPSPFYVMDEVEAALDDANLSRLLVIFEELRASSQLIVITHQKRTMEVADVLYGVSMQQDGVSKVVSQRLEPVTAL